METIEKLREQFFSTNDIIYKAKLINFYIKEKGLRLIDVARGLKLKPAYISHIRRLSKLPSMVIDGYYGKFISKSHLFTLSRLSNKNDMVKVYESILKNNLSVAQTENIVRELIYKIKNEGRYLTNLQKENFTSKILKNNPNLKIKITQTRTHGKINIKIYGNLKKTTREIKKLLTKLAS